MTIAEYKVALEALSDSEFAEFRRAFGGDFVTRQQYVDDFVHHPGHERRLCQLLGLVTEDEKRTAALTSRPVNHGTSGQTKGDHGLVVEASPSRRALAPFLTRYQRLSMWNKIAFWGSCASIVALAISVFPPSSEPMQGTILQHSPNSTINQPGRDLIIGAPTAKPTLLPAQKRLLELVASYQKQFAANRLIISRSDGGLHFDDDPIRGSKVSLIAELFGAVSPHNAGRFEELVQSMPAQFVRVSSEVRWDNPFVLSVTPEGMAEVAGR